MKYNADYFIKFFKKIPDKKWTTGAYGILPLPTPQSPRCALGHLGLSTVSGRSKKIKAFECIVHPASRINDGMDMNYQQRTPKQRILAALADAKKKGL